MTKKTKVVISAIVLLFGSILLYIIHHTYAYISPPALIYIPDKNSTDSLLVELQKQNAPLNFLDYRLIQKYPYPKSGWVRFDPKQKITREEFLRSLHKKPREDTRRIVMYAGDSIELFAQKTAKQTNLPAEEIIEEYRRLSPYRDGGIMAGYYQIPYKTTPTAIAYYMIHISKKRFQHIADRYNIDHKSKKWKELLTIASIIQKETQVAKEMPLISSVIYNRLKRDMKLQLDGTLNYGIYSDRIVTPERIKKDKSKYNTYLYKGLPPSPISSVTENALMSAIKPLKTDYLYFMLADNGTHNFAVSYEVHLANIRWYNEQKAKNTADQNSSDQNRSDKNSTN